ncbi:MAG: PAS domain S-box protein [Planctomycetes bacterium]|nr:PAS domain S-box protein [Planctomycetota bacterium]MCH9727303.1 PAS domain S-box protein [Planctomycetota bacterium]MCH9779161.1 PAS domain S-box protein [Planctomycetota bacterium]MCH9792259.1 PAS domain S-box protein [Planctomycetota bacterium]
MRDVQGLPVLLVEADPESRSQIIQILSSENYRIDTAETITQMMDRDNWSDYFLIILEHELPDGRTDELLPRLQKLAPDAELLIITSQSRIENMVIAFRNEIADYFVKPIDPELFRSSLKRILQNQTISSELRQTQAQLKAIVETAIEGVITIDRRGLVQSFNRAAEKMFGYSASEIINKNVSLLTRSPTREQHDQYISHYLETGISDTVGARRELNGCRRDGTIFPIELSVTDLPQFGVFAGIIADISERKQAEQKQKELTRAIAIAGQQERRQLANLLHDHLQQLLVGVRIHLEIAKKDTPEEAIKQTLERADELLNQGIELTRSLTAELNPVVLHEEGLATALEWLSHNMKERYNLTVTLDLDRRANSSNELTNIVLYECIRELLFNVVKHSQTAQAEVRMSLVSEQKIEIVVSDEGIGFDPRQLDKQLSEASGIGLSNIEFRLSLIKGKFWLESSNGNGTIARMIAPTDSEESKALDDKV